MGQPFVGEIRMVGFSFAPAGWAFCNGQLMPISENETLFTLIGTTYGGDGQSTFALPNLQGRMPVHQGTGSGLPTRTIGEAAGVESVTLISGQLPLHTHVALAQTASGNQPTPGGNIWASSTLNEYAGPALAPNATMNAGNLLSAGGNQPHENMSPFLTVNFVISLFGIFPSQN